MFENGMNNSSWLCELGGFLPGPFGMVITLLFWGIAILLMVKLLHFLFFGKKNAYTYNSTSLPLHILQERFAKGELSKAEYEGMKKVLL